MAAVTSSISSQLSAFKLALNSDGSGPQKVGHHLYEEVMKRMSQEARIVVESTLSPLSDKDENIRKLCDVLQGNSFLSNPLGFVVESVGER